LGFLVEFDFDAVDNATFREQIATLFSRLIDARTRFYMQPIDNDNDIESCSQWENHHHEHSTQNKNRELQSHMCINYIN